MLTPADLELLEASLLPALERHYLRLLAHGLRTFQAVAASSSDPERFPSQAQLEAWAALQPSLAADPAFQEAFLAQLPRLAAELERIASRGPTPLLSLQISDLVHWGKEQADARLRSPGPPPG
ncbi:MAG: hypothetical protein VKO44_07230 [Cyanobacteriota bacterium]|nr:hypothetical protein [Cyanobacteriota bacterium]